jgi:hypothetical protein
MALRRSIIQRLNELYPDGKNKWSVEGEGYSDEDILLSLNGENIGQFTLIEDPTCCGASILSGISADSPEVLALIPKIAEDVAKHRVMDEDGDPIYNDNNVGLLYFTHSNQLEIDAVKSAGWAVATEFYNPNSGNNVTLLFKRLYKIR